MQRWYLLSPLSNVYFRLQIYQWIHWILLSLPLVVLLPKLTIKAKDTIFLNPSCPTRWTHDMNTEYWKKYSCIYIYIHIILYIQYTHYHIHIHIYIIYGKHSPCRNYKLHIPFPNCELHLVCIPSRYPPFSGGNLLSRKDQEPPVSWNLASGRPFYCLKPALQTDS